MDAGDRVPHEGAGVERPGQVELVGDEAWRVHLQH